MGIKREEYLKKIENLNHDGALDRFKEIALSIGDISEGSVVLERKFNQFVLPEVKRILATIDQDLQEVEYLQGRIVEYGVNTASLIEVQNGLGKYIEALITVAEENNVGTLAEALEIYKDYQKMKSEDQNNMDDMETFEIEGDIYFSPRPYLMGLMMEHKRTEVLIDGEWHVYTELVSHGEQPVTDKEGQVFLGRGTTARHVNMTYNEIVQEILAWKKKYSHLTPNNG
jgi:hypothetical protein